MNPETPAGLRAALLQRLRFERDLGLDAVRPVPLETRQAAQNEFATGSHGQPTAGAARATPAPDAAAQLFDAGESKDIAALSPAEKSKRWETLEVRALGCTRCVLHRGRTKVVFGDGNRQARLVFVGEGPGADEDRTGVPFVGKAGQLLNKIIGAMGLQREDVYICNIVKCRPPENRTPLPDEVALCQPFLEEQLALLAPQAIVALGSPAAKALLKTSEGITQLRGRWRLYKGTRVMPTYHPAFVLRQYTAQVRRQVWDDMQLVMKYLKEEGAV